ncbi:GNAT family N-acetyltransferase [Salinispira pacifica]
MKVTDLSRDQEELYFHCLEDWSEEMQEAGDLKRRWYARAKDRGLRVKLAEDERGTVGGMIQYVPATLAPIEAEDIYFVLCIWVHGYAEGRGNFQRRGMGRALLRAAEEDVRLLGAKGLAAWGVSIPVFMRASWFRRQGYRRVDRLGLRELLFRPFAENVPTPKWARPPKRPPTERGQVVLACFKNGWCPAQNLTYERARKVAADIGGALTLREFDTLDDDVAAEWGSLTGVFLDGRDLQPGPPPDTDRIRRAIEKRVRRLGRTPAQRRRL